MGKITIIANNIFENASGSIRNDASHIVNQTNGKFIQNSDTGINYLNHQDRQPPTDIRITKVEGPFDGNDKLVDKIELGKSYSFKATPTRKPTITEVALLKWAIKLDNDQKEIIGGVASLNKLNGDKITIAFKITHDFDKAKIYAFYQKTDDEVSIDLILKKIELPILIGYSKGFDLKHHFMSKINKDVKKIALSQEDSTFGVDGIIKIEECDNLETVSETDLKKNLIDLIHTGTSINNGLKKVGEDMVNHFYKSSGGEYENDTLNDIISKDANFISFRNTVTYKVLIKLKQVNWDLSKIKENDLVRFDNVAFNTSTNHDNGLTILIDAVEHIEVYIEEYKLVTNNKYYLKLKFILYDTFGLDLEDVKKFGKRNSTSGWRYVSDWDNDTAKIYVQNNYGIGFTSWWLLQHKFNHKPYVTKSVLFVEGNFDKGEVYNSPKDKSKNTSNDTNYGQADGKKNS